MPSNALSLIFPVLLLFSCASKNQIEQRTSSDLEASVFSGILPCIDCQGIAVVLKLSGGNFEVEIEHPDSTGEISRSKGTYTIKRNTLFLLHADSLEIPLVYSINGNSLIPLALKNKPGEGHMLQRITNGLQEITWIPVELSGQKLILDTQVQRIPHVIFKIMNNRVVGNGGCNGFSGKYQLKANSIHVSKVIATKMACEGIKNEALFMMALGDCDNYSIHHDTLWLNKDDLTLLKLRHK